jgi:aldose 1-epimerase
MAAFPLPHTVSYTASIEGTTLTVTLGVRATGEVDVPISFGFHPYVTLPNSDRRAWQLQIPVAQQALVDERMLPTGETVELAPGELDGPLGERTFDTSYPVLRGDAPEFVIADDRHRLALKHVSGYPIAQVYAPEASQFICFEPMTAPVDALISGDGLRWIKPGENFEAIFSISVEQS